ncbi:MAG: CRTAC1 family protein [Acidobacteriota bacterium]
MNGRVKGTKDRRLSRRELLALLGASFLPDVRSGASSLLASEPVSPIRFALQSIPFRVETEETPSVAHAPAAMEGGVAVFDYNKDGRPDIFFTNAANIATLKKDSAKFSNKLFRNEGNGVFTDVTEKAGLTGFGYDAGVAVGDYDNDGYPDLFVAGVHRNTLYHNNGDGTFTDVTAKAGLGRWTDPEFGPLWAITGVWVDVNNDGLLDLFVVNYLQWNYKNEPACKFGPDTYGYCTPKVYKGLPNQLFLNKGDGTFEDVSAEWGIRAQVGKGMGAGMADYDLDGRPDLFVTNDTYYNFLFHNKGGSFEEVALEEGVALPENGVFISGMGLDFRDINNDGYPDIVFVALNNQTFPVFRNMKGQSFEDVTYTSGMLDLSLSMGGYGPGLYDFDNDGWKDLFVTRGHIQLQRVGLEVNQYNTVFRNLGSSGKWRALTKEAGLTASPPARHRGCAFGDFDGDGRVDVVATALGSPAEIWMNRSEGTGHWLDVALEGTRSNRDGIGAVVKLVTKAGTQYNHMTTSVGYASSSHGPVHFGLGADDSAQLIEIRWPSGTIQRLRDVKGNRVLHVKESSP